MDCSTQRLRSPNGNARAGTSACPRARRSEVSHQHCFLAPANSDFSGVLLHYQERRNWSCLRSSAPRSTHCWVFPWDCETGQPGVEGAAKEDQASEGTKRDTGQKVSVTVPVQGTTSLQVVQTKVTNSDFYS